MRKEICRAYHDDILSGHASAERTYQKIMNQYYWPGMVAYIAKYVSSCESCQRNKAGGKFDAPLQSIHCREAFERIGIDIVGPLPKSNNYQYIIIATCYFTRYAETRALENFQSGFTSRFLIENIISRHGCPSIIMSDQGTNFLSWLVQNVAKFMGSKWKVASAYHPQTNGLTEKTNQTLINMLTHYTKDQSKWYLALPLIQFAYNTSINSSTKASPFYLLYGRHPTLPIDIKLKPRIGPGSSDRRNRLEAYRNFITNGPKIVGTRTEIKPINSKDLELRIQLIQPKKSKLTSPKEPDLIRIRGMIENFVTPIVYDSGAYISLISLELIDELILKFDKKLIKIQGIQNEMVCLGLAEIPLTIGLITSNCVLHVMKNPNFSVLIGLDVIKNFQLSLDKNYKIFQHLEIDGQEVSLPIVMISKTDHKSLNSFVASNQDDQINKLLSEFSDIFAKHKYDVGCISFEQYRINLTSDIPISLRPYRCSLKDQKLIDDQIQLLLKHKIIQPSSSPYSAPISLVNKKDEGEKSRLVVDYRALQAKISLASVASWHHDA
ncbi:uncharacterized protein LOC141857357 [Brevipalpus obovatus]|uniref:uncharacterized protein LOC141857357 n=1 Tax=Brevipalpus obovatus TaxID=246614 RepID=UPI003D9DC7E4